ncbi:hypothetical protein KI387_044318, partial [Taxus chinensis]
ISLTPRGFGVTVRYIWYQSDHPSSSPGTGSYAGIAVFARGSYTGANLARGPGYGSVVGCYDPHVRISLTPR